MKFAKLLAVGMMSILTLSVFSGAALADHKHDHKWDKNHKNWRNDNGKHKGWHKNHQGSHNRNSKDWKNHPEWR